MFWSDVNESNKEMNLLWNMELTCTLILPLPFELFNIFPRRKIILLYMIHKNTL